MSDRDEILEEAFHRVLVPEPSFGEPPELRMLSIPDGFPYAVAGVWLHAGDLLRLMNHASQEPIANKLGGSIAVRGFAEAIRIHILDDYPAEEARLDE